MSRLLSQVSSLGPFFVIGQHPATEPPRGPWRPLAELVTDPVAMPARLAAMRSALVGGGRPGRVIEQRPITHAVERRVAGSAMLLGLAARLLSPALAAAVIDGVILDLELTGLYWQPELGTTFPLSIPADPSAARGGRPAATDHIGALAGRLAAEVLAGPVAQLVAAVRAACSLSPLVAWGNVGSALNGAAIVIGQRRPELAERTYRLTSAVLALPPLAIVDAVAGPGFRRTSCCLLYLIAGRAAVCADCVLPRG